MRISHREALFEVFVHVAIVSSVCLITLYIINIIPLGNLEPLKYILVSPIILLFVGASTFKLFIDGIDYATTDIKRNSE